MTIRDLVLFPDGNYNGYIRFINKKFWFDNAPSVYILPYYNGMVLLTRQYRHQERKFIWETPRGFGENGQSSEQSAIRELKEEIGVEPVELIRLTNPDNNGDSIFFFARLFDEHITLSDPHEGLAGFKFMSISQFELMIINGTISDKNTIILYTLSKLKNLI